MSFPIGTIQRANQISHGAGLITVTNLLVKIGGIHKFAASVTRTIATDVTLVANTRYQVFAVIVGGAVQLRISTNENSVGPAGFTAWELVGCFYSNGLTSGFALGAFVNIDGVPKTSQSVVTEASWSISGFAIEPVLTWERNGKYWSFTTGFQKNGSAGTGGNLTLNLPTNIPNTVTPSSARNTLNELTQVNGGNIGFLTFSSITGAVDDWHPVEMYSVTNGFNFLTQPSGIGSLAGTNVLANSIAQGFLLPTPMVGWTNTPIRDL